MGGFASYPATVPIDVEEDFVYNFSHIPPEGRERLSALLSKLAANPLLEPEAKDDARNVRACSLGDGWKFCWTLEYEGLTHVRSILGYLVYETDQLIELRPNL